MKTNVSSKRFVNRQGKTGFNTEEIVQEQLSSLGLIVKKPIPDRGVDLEVQHPNSDSKKIFIQVKGRGKHQRNEKYRWFQIRTTLKQREAAVKSGLSLSDAWRKKVDLCDFFIFVSERYGECWVFPKSVVCEIVAINRKKYGNRSDNKSGRQAEMNLDIEHEGLPLTKRYAAYLNNYQIITLCFTGEKKRE